MDYYQWKPSSYSYRKILILPLLIVTTILANTGCSIPENQAVSNPKSSAPPENSEINQQSDALNIAVIPAQSSEEQIAELKALSEYLEEKLKRKLDIQVQKDYETAINLLVNEQVEIAYLGPLSYVEAKQRNPYIEPIVAPITKATGRPWHTSVIIANSAKIKDVKDLTNKRFGFVSKSSTTGFLVPNVELFQKEKINPNNTFSEIKFLGSHDKALAALIADEVDAVAVEQEAYFKAKQEKKLDPEQYHQIWESSPLPTAPIVVSSKLDPKLINALQKALIDAPEGIVAVSGVETAGYTIVDDTNYEPIRQLQTQLSTNQLN